MGQLHVHSPKNAITKHMMRRPDSVMAAQYSMPYIVGATLSRGPRGYSAYESQYHRDANILSLIDKVEAHHEPEFDAYVPFKMPNRVVLNFADGHTREAKVIEALGSPERPLSFTDIMEKARPLIDMTDSEIDLDAIAECIDALPRLTSIESLNERLVSPNYDSVTGEAAAVK